VKILGFLIIKNHLHLKFVKIQWLKHLNMHLCARVVRFSKKPISQELLLELMEKINNYMGSPMLTCTKVIITIV
jgi:hypothetical protein